MRTKTECLKLFDLWSPGRRIKKKYFGHRLHIALLDKAMRGDVYSVGCKLQFVNGTGISLQRLLNMKTDEQPFIVDGLVKRGDCLLFSGPPKVGKSFFLTRHGYVRRIGRAFSRSSYD